MAGGGDTSVAYTLSPTVTLGQNRIIPPLGRGGMGEGVKETNLLTALVVTYKVPI